MYEHKRTADSKPQFIPSTSDFRALLDTVPGLMRRVCQVYMQDFICFGYKVPAQCEGMF